MASDVNKLVVKDISDILKYLRKSEDNFKKASIYLSHEEIRNKIESSIKKKENRPSLLSTNEKMRFSKIGQSFIKGTSDYFNDFFYNLKLKERESNKKEISILNMEDFQKDFSLKKKNGKNNFGLKLALFGAAFGISGFIIKKTYDAFLNNLNVAKINNTLSGLFPSSLKFYSSNSKIIDGEVASFVVTTSNGEEIALSNEMLSENPIEESAKTFDDINLDKILKKGMGLTLNNTDEKSGKSIIGHLIYTPFSVYISEAKRYLYDSMSNPKIGRAYKDMFWQLKTLIKVADISTSLVDVNMGLSSFFNGESFRGGFANRFGKYMLDSQNGYTNAVASILNNLNQICGKNKILLRVASSYTDKTRDVSITIGSSSENIREYFERLLNDGDYERFLSMAYNISRGYNFKTLLDESHDSTSGTLSVVVDSNFEDKELRDLFNIHGRGFIREIGKTSSARLKDFQQTLERRGMETFSTGLRYKDESGNIVVVPPLNKIFSDLFPQLMNLMAHHRLNKHFDVLDSLIGLTLKNNLETVKNYDDVIYENQIYFNKELKTHEKLKILTDAYFNPKSVQHNFILKFLSSMEESSEWGRIQMKNTIYNFKNLISPYSFIRETITGDKNDDLGLIMNSQFHNTNTILMGETSDTSSAHGVNNEILLQTIVNYTKSKMNFRKSKQDVLKRLLVKLVEIGKKQSKFFKGYAVLSDFERQTDENGTQMFGNTNEGYDYTYFMKHVNETIIDFDSYVFKSLQN